MSFLGPALLIGLLAAAIPPILHLIHRRKAEVVRFPALEFILRSNRKTKRRFRMKQLLLMLLRCLLLAALAFALARPYVQHGPAAAAVAGSTGGTSVLVIDASYPMGFDLEGETLLERSRLMAKELLDQLRGQSAVVIAGDRIEVPIGEVTQDVASVRKAVDAAKLSPRSGHLGEAVARAYELLADLPGKRRVVVLTTPAGAASALPAPPPATSGVGIELVAVDVSEGAKVPNRSVLDVKLRPAPEMGVGQWRVDARVGNYADEAVRRLPLHLEVDGEIAVRGFLDLGPGGEGMKTFYARLEAKKATPAAVVVQGDALKVDDRRDFWLQPAPRLRVLAVNGDPRPIPYRDELFYLERALAPSTSAGARVELTISASDTLDRHSFDDFDVVLMANVRAVDEGWAKRLEGFVRGGGGLFISMGDRVDRRFANRHFARLLPRTLRDVRQAGDAAASAEGGDRRSARLGAFDRNHPILRPFSDPASSSLGGTRVRRYMLLDPAPDAGGEVVIALDEGAPYLLARRVERGRVIMLTGTLDRDWGDLPIRADFVPLLQQVLRYLTRVAEVDTAPVLVGRPAPVPVEDPRVRRVQVKTPAGALHSVERPRDADEAWVFAKTLRPGHYQVEPDPPLPDLAAIPGFAVAVDPAGADLRGARTATPELDERKAAAAALTAGKRTELWHTALFALFLLLLGEGAVLFKRRRVVPA